MVACAGYQLVPSLGVGYNPQNEDHFLSANMTLAPPWQASDADREILRNLGTSRPSTDLVPEGSGSSIQEAAEAFDLIDWTPWSLGALLVIAWMVRWWLKKHRVPGGAA